MTDANNTTKYLCDIKGWPQTI